jgi:hypothetical protein
MGMQPPLAFRPHPWRGVDPGARFPKVVTAYVEIVPSDGDAAPGITVDPVYNVAAAHAVLAAAREDYRRRFPLLAP